MHRGNTHDDEIDIKDILYTILSHKYLVLVFVLISLLIGVYLLSKQRPTYEGDVLIHIKSGGNGASVMNPMLASSMGQSSTATQIALLKSRVVLAPVVRALNLNLNTYPSIPLTKWQRLLRSDHRTIEVAQFDCANHAQSMPFYVWYDAPMHFQLLDASKNIILQGKVGQTLRRNDEKISIKIKSINAPIGTEFTLVKQNEQAAVDSVSRSLSITELGAGFNSGISTGLLQLKFYSSNQLMIEPILNNIAQALRDLDASQKKHEAKKMLEFLKKQTPIAEKYLNESETKLNEYNNKNSKITAKIKTNFLIQHILSLDKQLDDLSLNKAKMARTFTTINPMMKSLAMQRLVLLNEKKISEAKLNSLPSVDLELLRLLRTVRIKRTMYFNLQKKILDLKMIEGGDASSIEILSKATLLGTSTARKYVYLLVSSFIGFSLSLIVIFGRKLLFQKIEDPYLVEKKYDLPTISILNYVNSQIPGYLLAEKEPQNLTIESLRAVRASLQVALLNQNTQIISILGLTPNVGKTFVTANLAYLLASAGKKVLIIDADLRRGTIHKYFNLTSKIGLSEVLSQKSTFDNVIKSYTNQSNLSVITRGEMHAHPSELLMRPQLEELLSDRVKHFDVVLIDTPPLLLVSDAMTIAKKSPVNYLVLGMSAHNIKEIEVTIKKLARLDITLFGTIYNHNTPKKSSYNYSAANYNRYYSTIE